MVDKEKWEEQNAKKYARKNAPKWWNMTLCGERGWITGKFDVKQADEFSSSWAIRVKRWLGGLVRCEWYLVVCPWRRTTVRFAKAIALSAKTDTLNLRDQQCMAQLLSRHFFASQSPGHSARETMHDENEMKANKYIVEIHLTRTILIESVGAG